MKDDEKHKTGVHRHTISLPPDLSEWVDQQRGDVSFSRFVLRALEIYRSHIVGKAKSPQDNAPDAREETAWGSTRLRSARPSPSRL